MGKVGIIGTGAWGTTLGVLAAHNGHTVTLLGRTATIAASYNAAHCNTHYLPNIPLPASLHFTANPEEALANVTAVIIAIPSAHLVATLAPLRALIGDPALPICSSVKGFLDDKLTRPSQALPDILGPHPIAVLSGPNLAKEVLRGDPTVTVVAAPTEEPIHTFRELLGSRTFRVYGAHDVVGVEIGGAVKNILALASGIGQGLGFGMNTQAALIARGLAELATLGEHLGAQRETLLGIAGLGDAICTCFSPLSRNVQLGHLLAQGVDLAAGVARVTGVAEGVGTASHVAAYAAAHELVMPITTGVAQIVEGTASVHDIIAGLLERTWKMEGA